MVASSSAFTADVASCAAAANGEASAAAIATDKASRVKVWSCMLPSLCCDEEIRRGFSVRVRFASLRNEICEFECGDMRDYGIRVMQDSNVADAHGGHAGRVDGCDSGCGVFHAYAPLRRYVENSRHVEEDLRIGLATGDVAGVGDVVEPVRDAEPLQ